MVNMNRCTRGHVWIIGLLIATMGGGLSNFPASALTYSQAVDVSFTFNPTISINLSSADLLIDELVPGSVKDSNVISVGVSTNNAFGYTLSANVGNDSAYDTRNLIRSDDDNKFTSIDVGSALDSLIMDNSWGFSSKLSGDSAEWASYSGLPLYSDTNNTATLIDTSSVSESSPVDFKIAAKASSDIPSGTYRNVINFIAVAKPEPTPAPIQCEENKICYSNNALDNVEGTMGKQPNATSNSTVTLLASNYSRQGFGFAGWNTAPDYSGTNYGPNEDVTMPADMGHGLPLYAMWVKSSGVMQGWNGCIGLNIGDVTALTDARDNDTYAVAKLADGKCWMIENLRLDNNADHNTDGTLSQGYNSSFIGLAGPESANFSDSTTANSLYSINGSTASTISGDNQGYRFPRYNNSNTKQRAENTINTNVNTYSYGNYYTWAAAIADTNEHIVDNQGIVTTSICPSAWHLPSGGDKANENQNNFWTLVVGGINNGILPLNYDEEERPYYSGVTEGRNVSAVLRSHPNNFLLSGSYDAGSLTERGVFGRYWSSTSINETDSYCLRLRNDDVRPGNLRNKKTYGFNVRCVTGP